MVFGKVILGNKLEMIFLNSGILWERNLGRLIFMIDFSNSIFLLFVGYLSFRLLVVVKIVLIVCML